MRPLAEIIVHCTATKVEWMAGKPTSAKVREIDRWHKEAPNFWSGIGYHDVIDRDGTVAEGRALTKTGAHVRGHNAGTIGVSLVGGHGSSENDKFSDNFTPQQDAALRTYIKDRQSQYPTISKISGHNEYAAKACPGFNVQKWLMQPNTIPQPPKVTDKVVPAGGAVIGGAVAAGAVGIWAFACKIPFLSTIITSCGG